MAHIERRKQRRPDGTLGSVKYRARYTAPDGRERSQSFNRRVDAQNFLTGISHDLLTGSYVDPTAGKITFKAFAEEWRRLQVHREGTVNSIEQHLRLHIYPNIGDRPIASIRPGEIQGMVQCLSKKLASTTVHVVYGRVVAIFHAAIRDRRVTTTPCVDIKLPSRKPASTLQVLSTDQVMAIANAINPRYRGSVIFGAGTGLRPGELFGLTQDRLDFLRKAVRVDQQLVRLKPNHLVLADPKTVASHRTIPVPQLVLGTVAGHLAEWPIGHEWGLVFTNTKGDLIQEHTFASAWATARSKAGVPGWATPHHLRHYYASVLIRSGASVKVVQTRLGHSSAKTTLDIYGHLFADEEDRTRDAIDREFGLETAWRRPDQDSRPSQNAKAPGQEADSA